MVKDALVAAVTRERDLGNILDSANLLRFFAMLYSPESSVASLPVLNCLNELLVFS